MQSHEIAKCYSRDLKRYLIYFVGLSIVPAFWIYEITCRRRGEIALSLELVVDGILSLVLPTLAFIWLWTMRITVSGSTLEYRTLWNRKLLSFKNYEGRPDVRVKEGFFCCDGPGLHPRLVLCHSMVAVSENAAWIGGKNSSSVDCRSAYTLDNDHMARQYSYKGLRR